jgi:hypothetical protein
MLMARLQGGTLEPQEGNDERNKLAVPTDSWDMQCLAKTPSSPKRDQILNG